jgi:hypothetical protein
MSFASDIPPARTIISGAKIVIRFASPMPTSSAFSFTTFTATGELV